MESQSASKYKITIAGMALILGLLFTQLSLEADFWKIVDYSDSQSTSNIELVIKSDKNFNEHTFLSKIISAKIFSTAENNQKQFYTFSRLIQKSLIHNQLKTANKIYISFCPAIVTLNKNNIPSYSDIDPFQA